MSDTGPLPEGYKGYKVSQQRRVGLLVEGTYY